MNDLNKKCGNRLKECLEEAGITQKELASLTGYTQQYISNIATGKKPMTIASSVLFAKHLNVSKEYLRCESDFRECEQELDFAGYLSNVKIVTLMRLLNLFGYKIKFELSHESLKEPVDISDLSALDDSKLNHNDGIIAYYRDIPITFQNVKVKINSDSVDLSLFMHFIQDIPEYIRYSIDNLISLQLRFDTQAMPNYEDQQDGRALIMGNLLLSDAQADLLKLFNEHLHNNFDNLA